MTPVARISGETHIARPPGVVFDLVADERNRYDPRILDAALLTDGPIGAGTRFRSVTGTARRPVEMSVEITEYDRPRRLASTTRTTGMVIDTTLVFEPTGSGTRMRWSTHLRPRGAFRLLAPVLGPIGRRQMRRIWDGLRSQLEPPSAPPVDPVDVAC